MIPKIVPKRKDKGSSFLQLARYLLVEGDKGEKILRGEAMFSENLVLTEEQNPEKLAQLVTAEMEIVAESKDARVRIKDPVFHFVLSWPDSERPTTEQWQDCVKTMLQALKRGTENGLAQNHQYIAVPHVDTDNYHVHIMVNLINAETGKAQSPELAINAIHRTARELEIKYGWQHDNGIYKVVNGKVVKTPPEELEEMDRERLKSDRPSNQNAAKATIWSGEESFEAYAKKHGAPILNKLKKDPDVSWTKIHQALGEVGLRLHKSEKGGYTVSNIGNEDKVYAKASKVFRSAFSGKENKKWLDALGDWVEPDLDSTKSRSNYAKRKQQKSEEWNRQKVERDNLAKAFRDFYQSEKKRWIENEIPKKKEAISAIKEQRSKEWETYRELRKSIKANIALSKDEKQRQIGEAQALYHINKAKYDNEIKVINSKYQFPSREAFAQALLETGDEERKAQAQIFLERLNWKKQKDKEKETEKESSATLVAKQKNGWKSADWKPDWGAVGIKHDINRDRIYSVNNRVIFVDAGPRIDLKFPLEEKEILMALELAKAKFPEITVGGSEQNKRSIAMAVVRSGTTARFAADFLPYLDMAKKALEEEQRKREAEEAARIKAEENAKAEAERAEAAKAARAAEIEAERQARDQAEKAHLEEKRWRLEEAILESRKKELYRATDGVKVVQENDSILISFRFDREMRDCLTHIVPDAKLDTDKGAWVVPMEMEDRASMAVNQMRGIFRDTVAEEKALTAKALEKNYEANVLKPIIRDGIRHQGTIVDLTERYALVHEKGNLFKLHRRDALGETKENKFLEKDQRIDVVYEKGKAMPYKPKEKSKDKEKRRGLER